MALGTLSSQTRKANRITFVAWGKEVSSHWKDTDEKVARAEIYFQMLVKLGAFI